MEWTKLVFIMFTLSFLVATVLVVVKNLHHVEIPRTVYKNVHLCSREYVNLEKPPTTIDSVKLEDNTRVLLTGQNSVYENGIWVTSSIQPWSRSDDMSTIDDIAAGQTIHVEMGKQWGHTSFVLQTLNVHHRVKAIRTDREFEVGVVFRPMIEYMVKGSGSILTRDPQGSVRWMEPLQVSQVLYFQEVLVKSNTHKVIPVNIDREWENISAGITCQITARQITRRYDLVHVDGKWKTVHDTGKGNSIHIDLGISDKSNFILTFADAKKSSMCKIAIMSNI